jgi:hypothetical protein
MLMTPHCLDSRLTDGGMVVSLTHPPHFTPQKHYYFYMRLFIPETSFFEVNKTCQECKYMKLLFWKRCGYIWVRFRSTVIKEEDMSK